MNIPLNLFEDYLRNKNLKERTLENYIYYFNKFNYDQFNQDTISRFMSLQSNRNTIARSFLVNFKKFLTSNRKILNINEEQHKEILETELPQITGRKRQRMIRTIPHEQIQILEDTLETEKDKLMLLISYYGGLRLGEMLKIQIISFNWEEWKKNPEAMGECRVYGKGDKEGIALLPAFLMKRIAIYIKNNNFESINSKIFVRNDKEKLNFKNAGRVWQNKLREAGLKAGITQKDEKGEIIPETSVHPHKLRHSYAIYLIKVKKLDIRVVQEILRHNSIQSTQIYTQLDKETIKNMLSGGNTPENNKEN